MQCAGEDQSQMDSLFMNARCSCGKDMKTGLFPLHRLPTLRLALKSTAIRDGLTNIYHLLVCFCFGLVFFYDSFNRNSNKKKFKPKKANGEGEAEENGNFVSRTDGRWKQECCVRISEALERLCLSKCFVMFRVALDAMQFMSVSCIRHSFICSAHHLAENCNFRRHK